MTDLPIKTAKVFEPLLSPARYKGAYGGRGSGKSHFFAEALIEDSLTEPGLLSVCIREVQKSLLVLGVVLIALLFAPLPAPNKDIATTIVAGLLGFLARGEQRQFSDAGAPPAGGSVQSEA